MLSSLILLSALVLGQPPAPTMQRIEITHAGLSLVVEGWQDTPGGIVHWRPDSPFNVAALATARKAKATPHVVRHPADPFPGGVVPDKVKRVPAYHTGTAKARLYVADLMRPPTEAGDGKLHVTVIGTIDETAPVVNDIKTNPAFAGLRENLLVQDYRADEWPVDPTLGYQPGKPAILVQASKGPNDPKGGRVIYRAGDYSMGPEKLAEAVRKADPNYKPSDDPGPSNDDEKKPKVPPVGPALCPFGFTRDHRLFVVAAAFAILYLYMRPRKETVKP